MKKLFIDSDVLLDNEFRYSFKALKNRVKFGGISLDEKLSIKENKALLKKCLVGSSSFELVDNKFEIK